MVVCETMADDHSAAESSPASEALRGVPTGSDGVRQSPPSWRTRRRWAGSGCAEHGGQVSRCGAGVPRGRRGAVLRGLMFRGSYSSNLIRTAPVSRWPAGTCCMAMCCGITGRNVNHRNSTADDDWHPCPPRSGAGEADRWDVVGGSGLGHSKVKGQVDG